ncbi:MAG TPA: sensor histidine kinase [Bacteroidia bacterium]|nr:sensor histidine kinase [Bacteroidia bacterium]
MNTLKEKLLRILRMGFRADMSEQDKRRVWIANLFYFTGTFMLTACTLQTFIVDGKDLGLYVLCSALCFQLTLPALLLRKFRLAESVMVIVAVATIFFFDNLMGADAGVFIYYLPFLLMIGFIADFRHIGYILFYVAVTISAIGTSEIYNHHVFYHYHDPVKNLESFHFNIIAASVFTSVITFLILWQNYLQYKLVSDQVEERKKNEEAMKISLREKEILLAEVHHRVKNNLAVISSLLNLQLNLSDNEDTRRVLLESRNRVSSMALIHQKLYRSSNVEKIEFRSYCEDLIMQIKYSYPEAERAAIAVKMDVERTDLSLTVSIPLGLVLNELLSNCYKHAFRGRTRGEIMIRFYRDEPARKFVLWVSDNGNGLPPGFEAGTANSLGMTIISSLCVQLDGQFSITARPGGGTAAVLKFS